jgi:hypothetical protein
MTSSPDSTWKVCLHLGAWESVGENTALSIIVRVKYHSFGEKIKEAHFLIKLWSDTCCILYFIFPHRLPPGSKGIPVEQLKKMRLQRKDFKKGGQALRGKNVIDNFRVKEKDVKRTMK